jgi:two-component system response regulator FixJ
MIDMRADQHNGEIFVVDDDPSVRDALSLVFKLEGYQVTGFGEGTSLLAAARARVPTCILLDVDMPGRSGLDILKELNAQDYPAPIVIISGKGQIAMVVDAIKHGALDFIEKPFEAEMVAARVREAIGGRAWRSERRTASDVLTLRFPGSERLTRRECEVLARIAAGATSKAAGRHLGISSRTVEVHRARVMQKLGAKNAADLMRIVLSENHSH